MNPLSSLISPLELGKQAVTQQKKPVIEKPKPENPSEISKLAQTINPENQVGGVSKQVVAEAQKAYMKEDAKMEKDKSRTQGKPGESLSLKQGWANQ